MNKKIFIIILLVIFAVVSGSCSSSNTEADATIAAQTIEAMDAATVAAEKGIHDALTQTAAAASPTPSPTLTPTLTSTFTLTPSPTPTYTPSSTPSQTPSFTPKPTSTPTRLSTNTPETPSTNSGDPSTIIRGPGEKSPGDHGVTVKNKTYGQVTIYMYGDKFNYIFYIPAGNNKIFLRPGYYSFTIYACGGTTSGSGVFNTNWYWEFSCN